MINRVLAALICVLLFADLKVNKIFELSGGVIV